MRLTLRDPARTLTRGEANRIRDLVYRAVHEGTRMELAAVARGMTRCQRLSPMAEVCPLSS